MAILYRCQTPTDRLCPCGRVARRLRAAEIDFAEVRVSLRKRDRDELEELSGQRCAPVLIRGEDVIHDSHRIVEFVEHVEDPAPAGAR